MPALLPLLFLLALPLPAESLRVMSFNVRFANLRDGEDRWENRRDLFMETIRLRRPDLIGTQELLKSQEQDMLKALPEFASFGRSRRGNDEDEHMNLFYRRDRLELLDSGDFWLSETPERAGSVSWEMSLPRMVTWGRFRLKNGPEILVYNTHFAHRREDEAARQRSARLIASRIALQDEKLPVLLLGDFNAPAGGETYRLLVPPLRDAWTEAAKRAGPEGTFHGFRGKPGEARIDWILFRAPWGVSEAETVTHQKEGRYPSDHFPVFAVFELP